MKKLYIVLLILTGIFIALLMGYFILRHGNREKVVDETRTVFIKKTENRYQLFRNGKPFYIQGAGGDSHFKELAEIGGNTIRLYDTINLSEALNEAQRNNLAVIVDIPLPRFNTQYNPYLAEENNRILKENLKSTIQKYKNHPAVLIWNLGNELQYPIVFPKNRIIQNFDDLIAIIKVVSQRRSFINTFNDLIEMVHEEDPNHPVSTSVATDKFWKRLLNIHLYSPELDLIGYNIFAPPKKFISQLDKLSQLIEMKPFYISEWGIEGPWAQEKTAWGAPIETTSTNKEKQYRENHFILCNYYSESLGSVAFYWGQKQERTHTWFNIFDKEGRKSQVFYELQNLWKSKIDSTTFPPKIKYMLLAKKGAMDNLVFNPNEITKAQLFFENAIDSTLKYNWEIYEEEWNYGGEGVAHKMPNEILGCFEKIEDSVAIIRIPSVEGPYRVFVNVYDEQGNFATTNTPFYVLNSK